MPSPVLTSPAADAFDEVAALERLLVLLKLAERPAKLQNLMTADRYLDGPIGKLPVLKVARLAQTLADAGRVVLDNGKDGLLLQLP
jgi:hypothetical protein